MRYDIIAQILEDAQIGTPGQNLFVYQMPADCQTGILIKPPMGGTNYDNNIPGYFRSSLHIVIRAQKHQDGEDLSTEVMAALLHKVSKTYYDQPGNQFAMTINHLLVDQLPYRYARMDGNGFEWSLNFLVSYVVPSI